MPLYEYLCGSCGHRFERIQKFSDPPVTECPSCGGVVEKLISSPAIQFKGSGWYINDYARSGKTEGKAESAARDGAASADVNAKADKPSKESKAEKTTSESAPKAASTSAEKP